MIKKERYRNNMRKPIILTALGTAAAAVTALCVAGYQKSMLSSLPARLPKNFTVTAHTGCEKTKDNTLASITAGAEAGADIVEIDLHFAPDGTPVLRHDRPASADGLPTFDSALEVLTGLDVKMNIDVKATDNLAEALALIKKHGVEDKVFFTGIEEEKVPAAKADAPGIPYYLNVKVNAGKNADLDYLSDLASRVRLCGAVGINMSFGDCSPELVRYFRSEGLLVSLWTANKLKDMKHCLGLAPDNITTRKPSVLNRLIGRS